MSTIVVHDGRAAMRFHSGQDGVCGVLHAVEGMFDGVCCKEG